ncbi:restriction endonuclease subunit S [Parabacteroides sp. OttesenSCG-928-J18]|nr:restriction endonuclease subunit S [Parabacteroides sp. OttesenSCG-928-J18]
MDTKKLRQKILDLAIRGKLVPQDPNDEPASVLIEKIRAEKERLIKEKKIKRDKNESYIYRSDKSYYEKFADGTVKCIDEEIPFEIPNSWVWCRLGSVAFYKKGPFGSSITKSMFIPESENAIKVYEQKNAIYKDVEIGGYYISAEKFEELKGFQVFPDDIIVSCAGTIGETYVMPKQIRKGIINQALMRIKLYNHEILDFYLMYFDFVLKNQANEQGKGTAIKNIPPFDILKNFLIPLPPIEEQYRIRDFIRIITKDIDSVDENRNTISILVAQAKSKILDLAIRGKLVHQDPNDEPASVLLERIKIEHPESKKMANNISDNSHYENLPFGIPENWTWCYLEEIATDDLGKTLDKVRNRGEYYPYLRSVNVRWGEISLNDLKEMKFEDREINQYSIKKGDLLICEGGEAGRCAVWNNEENVFFQNAIHRVRFYGTINPYFYMYVLWLYNDLQILEQYSKGVTIKHLTKSAIKMIPLPLPPINEQKKIVDGLESIYTILDEL